MNLYTIGFTKKSAKTFFETLQKNRVKTLVDTRLHNNSQLAGFSKRDDLIYFLQKLANIQYIEKKEFAPSAGILNDYRNKNISWEDYEKLYLSEIQNRKILKSLDINGLENACLLCSEDKPHKCHRRLLAEYLQKNFKEINIIHL